MVDAERVGGEVGRVIPDAPLRPPERQRLLHAPPPWVRSGDTFFVTICCTPRGQNQLATPLVFAAMRDAFAHYGIAGKLWAHLLVVMPDHLHALLAFPSGERQDGFFDHRLRTHESFEEKAHYIRMNPVRAGLASTPQIWPYVWPAPDAAAAR